jgi:hypothetical protein
MPEDAFDTMLQTFTTNSVVKVVTHATRTTLTYGEILFATLDLK